MIPSAVFILAIALQTKISLYSKFLRRFGSMPKTFNTCFVDLEKVYGPVLRNKLWRVLREYGVDDRLLLAVKSLYSCSEVCVRRIKSRPFTVGLRQWCVLSPLLFIVSIRGGKTMARGRIQPPDQFNPVRQIPCTFFQVPRFRLWTAMQQNWLLLVICKSHGIRPSSGRAVANSGLGPKRLATPGLHELNRQSQPSRGGRHICELQDQPLTFYERFDASIIFSTGSSACTRSIFRCT